MQAPESSYRPARNCSTDVLFILLTVDACSTQSIWEYDRQHAVCSNIQGSMSCKKEGSMGSWSLADSMIISNKLLQSVSRCAAACLHAVLAKPDCHMHVYTSCCQQYSEKSACPVAFACSSASFSPLTPTLHMPQRRVKLAVSVNWRALFACNIRHLKQAATLASSLVLEAVFWLSQYGHHLKVSVKAPEMMVSKLQG